MGLRRRLLFRESRESAAAKYSRPTLEVLIPPSPAHVPVKRRPDSLIDTLGELHKLKFDFVGRADTFIDHLHVHQTRDQPFPVRAHMPSAATLDPVNVRVSGVIGLDARPVSRKQHGARGVAQSRRELSVERQRIHVDEEQAATWLAAESMFPFRLHGQADRCSPAQRTGNYSRSDHSSFQFLFERHSRQRQRFAVDAIDEHARTDAHIKLVSPRLVEGCAIKQPGVFEGLTDFVLKTHDFPTDNPDLGSVFDPEAV